VVGRDAGINLMLGFDVDGWVRQEVVEGNGEQARGSSVIDNEERDQVRYR
jgi:hypothetical protein